MATATVIVAILAGSLSLVVLGCTAVALTLVSLITKPQRFFLRRLWPNAEAVA